MEFNKPLEEPSSSSSDSSSSQDKSIPSFKNDDAENTSVKTALKHKNEQLLKSQEKFEIAKNKDDQSIVEIK